MSIKNKMISIIESLISGESYNTKRFTPDEYTQMTTLAKNRGILVSGHVRDLRDWNLFFSTPYHGTLRYCPSRNEIRLS